MHRTWTLVALASVAACSPEDQNPLELTRLSTFTDSLGLVTGATFGEVGSVYVADVVMKAVFRIDDSTTRNLFPNGEGPGEVVQPSDVSFEEGILSVLDRGKGGTSIFSALEFVAFRPEDFGPGTRYITGTDSVENPLSAMWPPQSGEPVTDTYANSCRHGGRTYDMSVVDESTLLVQDEEIQSTEDAVIVPLGIACSDELVVLGYGISGQLFYRFYTSDLELIGTREFPTADEPDVPGLIFALRGDTLLTGRNRPLPKVELWLVDY